MAAGAPQKEMNDNSAVVAIHNLGKSGFRGRDRLLAAVEL